MTGNGGLPPASASVVRPVDLGWPERELSARPGDGALSRTDAVKDEQVRRFDVVTPSATLIGRPDRPEDDLGESLRRLHDEQHPAMSGHSGRMHRLDKARITHALCNRLDLTPWERDRAVGIMTELDLTAFGSQRAIPKVALVTIGHVVDDERQKRLGLADDEWIRAQPPDRLSELYEQFDSIAAEERFRDLLSAHDLDTTSLNRLKRSLREQLDDRDLHGAAVGRSPYRDPSMPPVRDRGSPAAGNGERPGDDAGFWNGRDDGADGGPDRG